MVSGPSLSNYQFMRHRFFTSGIFGFCLFVSGCLQAQSNEHTIDDFTGTWKGTSLCQVKNSPCHDEVVVYHITKRNSADSCIIQMNKIVNGVEEEMGPLPCRLDKNGELESSAFNGKWNFKLREGKLEGTLFARGSLFRKIEVSKTK
jgi:hypothetical protein